ncbi:MAG: DNA polymerase/3'-5' exonuclease PolX [Gammaproteobacteria bacterium]|nr:DNA polymerase/3'-5' exonuclease PolX [Gammaproteobacteria bacterium]
MPVHNNDIAIIFNEIADLLEIESANPFRIRAYRNAARTLQGMGQEVSVYLKQEKALTDLPGIGKDLAAKIQEILDTGHCQSLEKLRKATPAGLTDLLHIPGLGPKRVHALYHELDIHTPEQLLRAAKDGRVHTLPGFGIKTEQSIIADIEAHIQQKQRIKLVTAAQYAEPLVAYLEKVHGVDRVIVAGSYRRRKETVGDLDILVSAAKSDKVMDAFVHYDEVHEVLSKGTTRSTIILRNGLQVDLRVVSKQSFGAALYYFTGSKAHNIAVRRRAQQRKLKINEYGVYKGDKQIAGATEESVFESIGLPYIPPELRENTGEIEAAEKHQLPKLVELKDLRGDLHAHSKATDGHNSIKEMAEAARAFGFEYLAITEHSRHLTVAHGLDEKRLRKQIEEIDRLNAELQGITLLKGIELDILEDGQLDLPDAVLAKLDLVVGAVHSKFHLSRAKQTERILRAMDHPHFTLLAHPSGRLLETRDAYDVDMSRIIRHARQRGCYLELNAQPDRLDLLDTYCHMAKDEGVLISVDSDAHSINDFRNLEYGIGQARRGWLEKADVLNTRSLSQLRKLLKQTM